VPFNDYGDVYKHTCTTTNRPNTKSNSNTNRNTKEHAINFNAEDNIFVLSIL